MGNFFETGTKKQDESENKGKKITSKNTKIAIYVLTIL